LIPLKDDNPRLMVPVVNFALIAINVLVSIYEFYLPPELRERFVYTFGAIPQEITTAHVFYPLFTAMFLHGGLMHLLSNMLYLFIFGDNVEGLLGHGRYLLFYLICGIGASALHIFVEPDSLVPMIGASGAISGVLGAYALKFPRARVLTLIPIVFYITTVRVPAVILLGFWFLMQLTSGLSSMGVQTGGGVAWFAHIGGFVVGLLIVNLFQKHRPQPVQW